jgi:predicted heme/steroid binding protein
MGKITHAGAILLLLAGLLTAAPARATEEFALTTGLDCGYCHLSSAGGGELTAAGLSYRDFLHASATPAKDGPLTFNSPSGRLLRLLAGFLHILTGIFWFGTILYVHIVLKPAYASGGLPRGEVRVGLISMALMAVTGTILTLYRVPSFAFLLHTRFGILLSIKVAIFLAMLLSALIVVFGIGPRLRKKMGEKVVIPEQGNLTPEQLVLCDGQQANKVCVAYQGKIYDVTASKLWRGGSHFKKHSAGADLTTALAQAPHGEEKILAMPLLGNLITAGKTKRPLHERVFYFMAYFNLMNVFLIILILALWRWW